MIKADDFQIGRGVHLTVTHTIRPQPQTQASLNAQLLALHMAAARLGFYDAADWMWRQLQEDRSTS